MFDLDKLKSQVKGGERDSAEMHALLFPKPSDRAFDIAVRECLATIKRIMTEELPGSKERSAAEMHDILFPGRRAAAPVEFVSLFVDRRRRPR